MQGHVSRLRAAFADAGVIDAARLHFAGDGYQLVVDPELVDAHQFRTRCASASEIDDPVERMAQLRVALDLWRGPALADAVDGWARERLCAELEEQRLAAFEEYAAIGLDLQREREILPELARMSNAHPGRESLVGLYMRALHRTGRRADALDVYARARNFLADELGIDPGPALRQLHQAILRDDDAPASSSDQAAPPPADQSAAVVPRQLPLAVGSFTGRQAQLDEILAAVATAEAEPPAAPILTISGTAGVGKTALAVHAGHRLADRYPDGQLFIDLHGFTQGVPPVEPGDALDRMLRAMNIPGERIPNGLEDRAALWRSVLAGRRVLIVLDNAATEAQVAPLLPGAAGCLALVTSRRRIAGLDATYSIILDVLSPADALTLFTRVAGRERCGSAPTEVLTEAIELCSRLPLALRIAAARLRSHPSWSVAGLVDRLRNRDQRLAELADSSRGVAAALDLSYRSLPEPAQQLYRLLGVHPGPDLDAFAAAALAGTTGAVARRRLDQLLDVHLLLEPTPGRYRFHDLVRAHAQAVAGEHREVDRNAALTRLLDYYRHVAATAADHAYPHDRGLRPPIAPTFREAPDLSGPTSALRWLDAELPNLAAVAEFAASQGRLEHAWQLPTILHRHLRVRGHLKLAETMHDQGLAAARADGSLVGEAAAHRCLGHIKLLLGRNEEALAEFQQASTMAGALGDRATRADALNGAGYIYLRQGKYRLAQEQFQRVLSDLAPDDHAWATNAQRGLAFIHRTNRRYDEALTHFGRALESARAAGNRFGEIAVQLDIALVNRMAGRIAVALDQLERALVVARAVGYADGQLDALLHLGDTRLMRAEYQQAASHFEEALALARAMGAGGSEFEALQGWGRVHQLTGQPARAVVSHQQALALATRTGQPDALVRALDGLAYARRDLGQPELARRLWERALAILTDLGLEQASDEIATVAAIRAQLRALTESPDRVELATSR